MLPSSLTYKLEVCSEITIQLNDRTRDSTKSGTASKRGRRLGILQPKPQILILQQPPPMWHGGTGVPVSNPVYNFLD